MLYPEDSDFGIYVFEDKKRTQQYYKDFPTIHHLIKELIENEQNLNV